MIFQLHLRRTPNNNNNNNKSFSDIFYLDSKNFSYKSLQ